MICSDFWVSFWSNGLSTLIAGTILGGIFGLIASGVSHNKEKKQKALENQILITQKALFFMDFLEMEIEDIISYIDVHVNKIKSIESMRYLRFDTSFWEILKTSGEVPSLLAPTALKFLTIFYASVNKCNLLYEQFLDAENNGRANIERIILEEYTKEINSVITLIETSKIDLIVDQEIENKKRELETLENYKKKPRRGKL